MEVKKNSKLIERKRFLISALHNKNITKEEYEKEIHSLDWDIWKNVRELLAQEEEKIKADFKKIKVEKPTDGDLKRAVAKYLMKFLENYFVEEEIKGIFRQGYKIMRAN